MSFSDLRDGCGVGWVMPYPTLIVYDIDERRFTKENVAGVRDRLDLENPEQFKKVLALFNKITKPVECFVLVVGEQFPLSVITRVVRLARTFTPNVTVVSSIYIRLTHALYTAAQHYFCEGILPNRVLILMLSATYCADYYILERHQTGYKLTQGFMPNGMYTKDIDRLVTKFARSGAAFDEVIIESVEATRKEFHEFLTAMKNHCSLANNPLVKDLSTVLLQGLAIKVKNVFERSPFEIDLFSTKFIVVNEQQLGDNKLLIELGEPLPLRIPIDTNGLKDSHCTVRIEYGAFIILHPVYKKPGLVVNNLFVGDLDASETSYWLAIDEFGIPSIESSVTSLQSAPFVDAGDSIVDDLVGLDMNGPRNCWREKAVIEFGKDRACIYFRNSHNTYDPVFVPDNYAWIPTAIAFPQGNQKEVLVGFDALDSPDTCQSDLVHAVVKSDTLPEIARAQAALSAFIGFIMRPLHSQGFCFFDPLNDNLGIHLPRDIDSNYDERFRQVIENVDFKFGTVYHD